MLFRDKVPEDQKQKLKWVNALSITQIKQTLKERKKMNCLKSLIAISLMISSTDALNLRRNLSSTSDYWNSYFTSGSAYTQNGYPVAQVPINNNGGLQNLDCCPNYTDACSAVNFYAGNGLGLGGLLLNSFTHYTI